MHTASARGFRRTVEADIPAQQLPWLRRQTCKRQSRRYPPHPNSVIITPPYRNQRGGRKSRSQHAACSATPYPQRTNQPQMPWRRRRPLCQLASQQQQQGAQSRQLLLPSSAATASGYRLRAELKNTVNSVITLREPTEKESCLWRNGAFMMSAALRWRTTIPSSTPAQATE